MTIPTVTVKFSCALCGLKDVAVQVRARASEDEDIADWMNVLARAVGIRHGQLSLLCESKEIKNLKIPVDRDKWLGAASDRIPPDEGD